MLSRSQLLLLLWVETSALALFWAQGHRRHVPPPVVPAPAPVAAMPCTACPVALPTQTQKPHPAPLPLPLRAWKLAFVRDNDVWTANSNGTNARLLIRNANSPRWSWDHKQLAFARKNNIWTVNADGTGARPLTTQWKPEPDYDGDGGYRGYGIAGLTWDPLTDTVLFSHYETLTLKRPSVIAPRSDYRDGTTLDADSLFAVSAQPGANRVPVALLDVTEQGTHFGFSHQEQPTFSRSGQYLAFARNGDIWLAQRGERRNTHANLEDWDAWEWDVSRLKAEADYDDPNYHGSRWNLGVTGLAWSPDEKHLAYARHRLDGSGYAVVNVLAINNDDGCISAGATREICDNDGAEPCFTPDSKWITYSHFDEYTTDQYGRGIWITSLDGKTSRKLIGHAEQPAW